MSFFFFFFFFSSRRRHTRFSGVTGVQTCALPIYGPGTARVVRQAYRQLRSVERHLYRARLADGDTARHGHDGQHDDGVGKLVSEAAYGHRWDSFTDHRGKISGIARQTTTPSEMLSGIPTRMKSVNL